MIEPKHKEAFLLSHLGLGDNIMCIGMVNYLTQYYDKVHVVCKSKYYNNMLMLHKNDKINYLRVNNDENISPRFGFNKQSFDKVTSKWDVFLCGLHIFDGIYHNNFPLGFYDDLEIDRNIFWTHFSINKLPESLELYKKVENIKYIVVHNISSTGKVFNSKQVIEKYGDNSLLIINFNENEYKVGHKYYEIAQEFINKPLAYYKEVIENAEYIFLTDSSFFCLAIQLDIKTDNCYYISRDNVCYDHLYNIKIFTPELKKKQIKQIVL